MKGLAQSLDFRFIISYQTWPNPNLDVFINSCLKIESNARKFKLP